MIDGRAGRGRILRAGFGALLYLLAASTLYADEVVINSDTSPPQTDKIELKEGEAADVTVYLKSLGDIVEGKKVRLRNSTSGRISYQMVSDRHGMARFLGVEPGVYRLSVEKGKNDRGGDSTVDIGDLKLAVRRR